MSTETSPLNPEPTDHDDDSLSLSLLDSEINKKRDPLYILIFYAFSLAVSVGGFGCAVWGYIIVRNAPFDEYHKKSERESYEKYFYGMQSIWVLLGINILWTALNLRLAFKGLQNELWPLNMAYDVLLWATLIAFGVLNMIEALWDRRLCDGHWKDEEMYKKCDIAMFQLLVVELVSVNLGLLAAYVHFKPGHCGLLMWLLQSSTFHPSDRKVLYSRPTKRHRTTSKSADENTRGGRHTVGIDGETSTTTGGE